MLSDLNSVILEGEIVLTIALDKAVAPQKVQLRSVQVKGATNCQSFFMVDIRHSSINIREELGIGRKIRVVGRLVNAKRKNVELQAEHIEIQPIHQKLDSAFD